MQPATSSPSARGPTHPFPPPSAAGPRDCVGQALAMLELQAVLATLAGRFAWALPGGGAAGTGGEGSIEPLQRVLCYHM
jgi:cytochrome P450